MTPKPTKQQSKIEPPSSWSVKTDYGIAKTVKGAPLVRLEDVHAWLVDSKKIPSASAAAHVFSVFISDSASKDGLQLGASKVRGALHILDRVEYPSAFGEYASSKFFSDASKAFPHVPHHHFEAGTKEALLYAMGLAAAYLWLPVTEESTQGDLNEQLSGYCPNGEFSSHQVCKSFLGRLAISLDAANALWGWGNASDVVQLHSVNPADKQPTTWAELKRYHVDNPGHAWTQALRQIAAIEDARRNAAGHTGVRKAMANELNMTPQGIGHHIRKAPSGTKSGRGRKAA